MRLGPATVSARAPSSLSASAHGEHETANERSALQSVTVPTAHAPPSMRLLPPPLHRNAAGSVAIRGMLLLATAHFRSIRTAALKIVAVGEVKEEVGS